MYTMIVVDDEREIRKGFCTYFPWEKIGFSILADFSSAQAADEFLIRNPVDVVVTDIKMLSMSGLELIEAAHARAPETVFIVVSGYRNFEYARQAMRFGVRHYLVKPIKYAQIVEEFSQIRAELDAQRSGTISAGRAAEAQKTEQQGPDEENEMIRRIKEFIHVHYEDATLESTAQHVKINPYYLSTFFHQQTGEKFSDYLTRARMKEAARLLTRTSMQIQDIARRVGYTTSNSFSRSFRQCFQMTPKEYRLRGRSEHR
ncbi:MAG: helix-turn-helix domain-containing protein [Clostridiales bacterium]|nr:helix-turn-helix domain-containing protein [Clostridiales bacterium]